MRQHTALYATGGAAVAVALFALWRRRRTRRAPPAAEEAIANVHAVDGSRGRVVGGAATERPEGATLFEGVLAPDECAATLAAIDDLAARGARRRGDVARGAVTGVVSFTFSEFGFVRGPERRGRAHIIPT